MTATTFIELLKFKREVDKLNFDAIDAELERMVNIVAMQSLRFENSEAHMQFVAELNGIRQTFENSKLSALKQRYLDVINEREHVQLLKAYDNYEKYGGDDDYEYELSRTNSLNPDEIEALGELAAKFTNWEYPSMEFEPFNGTFTRSLVAGDPLYLVSKHEQSLTVTTSQFPIEYVNRLRQYNIQDTDFSDLPQNTFGTIFSYGWFEYVPLEVVKTYMREFFNLLRPGGVITFSYNNCEMKGSLSLTFSAQRPYNTFGYMSAMLHGLGFDVVEDTEINMNTSVLALRKPGKLKSQRTGQTLGIIKKQVDKP